MRAGLGSSAQLSQHWATILEVFEGLLSTLRQANVPAFLVRKLFQQLFSFVNVQLFNQLLLRRECCSFSNGEYVKTGLGEVEQWILTAGSQWVGESWDQLKYIRQVHALHPADACSSNPKSACKGMGMLGLEVVTATWRLDNSWDQLECICWVCHGAALACCPILHSEP